jgi:hypothetical protein
MIENKSLELLRKPKSFIKNLADKVFLSTNDKKDFDKTKQSAYKVRADSIFLDEVHFQSMLHNGWCIAENVITPKELNGFNEALSKVKLAKGFEMGCEFMNLGCMPNAEIRSITQEVIAQQEGAIFKRVFKMEKIEQVTGGTFVLKPAHENSGLEVHQDASIVDESCDFSFSVWIPLVDITSENGAMWMLPGSHLWGNEQRGFGVPWSLKKHIELMRAYMQPVYLKAGDVLIFDTAVVHASAPNTSGLARDALFISAVRKDPEIIYYYKNKDLPNNVVEKYYVDRSFFDSYDFTSKPDETKYKKDVIDYKELNLSKREMVKLIRQYMP